MAKKKAEKAADKALKKAKDAVAEAKRRAKKVDGKAKRRAKKVESELKAVASRSKKGAADLKPAKSKDPVVGIKAPKVASAPRTPASAPSQAKASAPIATSKPAAEDLSALTVAQLRSRARDKGVSGYGKFTKAQLVAALTD